MNNNNNNSSAGKMILFFFELQIGIKMFHWQTSSYSNHKATDKLLVKLADLTDSFLEKYFGAIGKRPVLRSGSSVPLENMTKTKLAKLLDVAVDYLSVPLAKIISKHSDLLNIRDEMIAEINQAKYLLSLS